MKRERELRYGSILILSFLSVFARADGLKTQINYDLLQLDSDTWKYNYSVQNLGLSEPIQAFSIWFDYGKYTNLILSSPSGTSANWDELILQPEPLLQDAGCYDVLGKNGQSIALGALADNFSVTFDWFGTGIPASQGYTINNPTTFALIDSGITVPEPMTGLYLAIAFLSARLKRKKLNNY